MPKNLSHKWSLLGEKKNVIITLFCESQPCEYIYILQLKYQANKTIGRRLSMENSLKKKLEEKDLCIVVTT